MSSSSPFYAFESLNCSAVQFNTLEQAQAWIAKVIPAVDVRGAADAEYPSRGWTVGTQAEMLASCGDDVQYETADEVEARYAECIAAGYYAQ